MNIIYIYVSYIDFEEILDVGRSYETNRWGT